MSGPAPQSVLFRWLGVAGIELRTRTQTLAIDPFFTRPPLSRVLFGRVEPDRELIAREIQVCHDILITHAHWDHVMDVPEIARQTGATAWGSANACALLALCGVPEEQIRQLAAGEPLSLPDIGVEVIPAQHRYVPGFRPGPLRPGLEPPLRLRDYRMDDCFSFLLTIEGLRVLDWRSVRAASAPPADVLFVDPHGTRAYYTALVRQVSPKLIVPVHWDDFFRPLDMEIRPGLRAPRWVMPPLQRVDLGRFERTVRETDAEVAVLLPEVLRWYRLQCFA